MSAAFLAVAAPAGAVDLPKSQSHLASAQIVNGTLVWFQRNDRVRHKKRGGRLITKGVGAIYARPLDSKKATRVYMPPAGSRIVDFKVRSGRIAVGLATIAKGDRGPSSIVELTPGAGAWTSSTLATEPDADATGCGQRVRLVGFRPSGTVLAERTALTGRNGQCMLVRQESSLISVQSAESETVLGKRVSGWASAVKWNLLPALLPTNEQFVLQMLTSSNGIRYAGSRWDPATNDYSIPPAEATFGSLVQVFGDGKVLLREGQFLAGVLDTAKPSMSFMSLIGGGVPAEIWYRACGDQLLEIKRSWRSSKWRLKLRNGDGEAVRSIKVKIPHGASFDACDANVAIFHRPKRSGGIRQWAVDLTP